MWKRKDIVWAIFIIAFLAFPGPNPCFLIGIFRTNCSKCKFVETKNSQAGLCTICLQFTHQGAIFRFHYDGAAPQHWVIIICHRDTELIISASPQIVAWEFQIVLIQEFIQVVDNKSWFDAVWVFHRKSHGVGPYCTFFDHSNTNLINFRTKNSVGVFFIERYIIVIYFCIIIFIKWIFLFSPIFSYSSNSYWLIRL